MRLRARPVPRPTSPSRQIQRLEERPGIRLLVRTKQGYHLTEAHRVFLPQNSCTALSKP
ncbi:LysR family transcriptional regulator [Streptomyces sp. NPDC050738]|uniref:LysR family transcriptional regulator n=1 Tax=Streptomyces sp. NPDC050738 TaxID=3154744 RepID=UPI0034221C5C